MIKKRTIVITILIFIIILLLAGIIYFLFMLKSPATVPSAVVNTPANNNLSAAATTTVKQSTPIPNAKPATTEEQNKFYLEKVADAFAERLGSYSNQANFSNISDLKVYMTASMQSWADKYIATNQKNPYSGVYQGVTTRAISTEIKDYNDTAGKADILVHTQKLSVNGTSNPVTTNQDITITFVKQNSKWLVDNAKWK
jgi:hypothetical protein